MRKLPPVRYARTDDAVDIAYWKRGRGPVFLHTPNIQLSHILSEWTVDGVRRWYDTLARSFTLVRYDHRGGGLSTRAIAAPSIDSLVHDMEKVVGQVADSPLVLYGAMTGGLPAIAYTARHPEKVSHLVLWCSFARDASHGQAPRLRSLFEMAATDWELFTESIAQAALGWEDSAQARQWAAVVREATTQEELLGFLTARRAWDVSSELEQVEVPTLVIHDESNALAREERSRELAAGIPDAHFVVCGSDGGVPDDAAIETIRTFAGRSRARGGKLETLTAREQEVLALVAAGASNAEIAERLFISIHTVTRHLTHVYAKTGSQSRAQAVRYALDHGLGSS